MTTTNNPNIYVPENAKESNKASFKEVDQSNIHRQRTINWFGLILSAAGRLAERGEEV